MAVAVFGTVSTNSASTGNPLDVTHTVGTGESNTALVVGTGWFDSADLLSSVTWDQGSTNQDVPEEIEGVFSANERSGLSGVAAPTEGSSLTCRITWDGSVTRPSGACVNLSGVDQTTPFSNAVFQGTGSSTTTNLDITAGDADSRVIDSVWENQADEITPDATQLWDFVPTGGSRHAGGQHTTAGSNPTTLTWTNDDGDATAGWAHSGMLINAAAAVGSHTITPLQGDLALSTAAATVTATDNRTIAVPQANLSLSTEAPTIAVAATITVPQGDLSLTTAAPTVTATDTHTVSPAQADLTLTTAAPTVTAEADHTAAPPQADLALTTAAPTTTATDNHVASVPQANLALDTTAPTVTATDNHTVQPGAAALDLSTFAPTLAVSGDKTIQVPQASLTLTTFAPTAVRSSAVITIPQAILGLTTFAPTLTEVAGQWTPATEKADSWSAQSELSDTWSVQSAASTTWTVQ